MTKPVVEFKQSPNYSRRPAGVDIDCIVMHADASRSEHGTVGWILNATSRVSYHYLIGRDGRIWQFVADQGKAWHAGKSVLDGRENCNDYAIGVSFSNAQDGEPLTGVQLSKGAQLCAWLCREHAIPVARIVTHKMVSPGRKTDPEGPRDAWFSILRFRDRVAGVLGA